MTSVAIAWSGGGFAGTDPSASRSIAPFLPQLAFPSQPSSIWTTEGPVVHDVEEDPEAAAEEIPVDNEDDAERQGIKLRIGVASKTSEPELVRLARFESRRLGTSSCRPKKKVVC